MISFNEGHRVGRRGKERKDECGIFFFEYKRQTSVHYQWHLLHFSSDVLAVDLDLVSHSEAENWFLKQT